MGDHGHENEQKEKYGTFFEGSTVGIGFVYTIIALGIIGMLFLFG